MLHTDFFLVHNFLHKEKNREENERFGDFCIRKEYVNETGQGSDFHD